MLLSNDQSQTHINFLACVMSYKSKIYYLRKKNITPRVAALVIPWRQVLALVVQATIDLFIEHYAKRTIIIYMNTSIIFRIRPSHPALPSILATLPPPFGILQLLSLAVVTILAALPPPFRIFFLFPFSQPYMSNVICG